jgi:hypothetical protein
MTPSWTLSDEEKPKGNGRLELAPIDEMLIASLSSDTDALMKIERDIAPLDWQVETLGRIVRDLDAIYARLERKRN